MKIKITFLVLTCVIMGHFVSINAQLVNNIQGISAETPLISGGAESSMFIEKQMKLGTKSTFYKINQSLQAPSSINGATAISTIEGINFDENGTNNGGYFTIPPDPSGAIGPNHLVSVTNTSIEWFTKSGTQLNSQSLSSFFALLSPLTNTFDPKVIYDQYEERFVVVTLERTSGTPNTSKIFVAVSATSDPTGTWYFHSINSLVNISGVDHWADYPGFAVGKDAVFITNNLFSHASNAYGGTRLWTVDKGVAGGFYSGAPASVSIVDPFLTGGLASTLQPAHMFGTPPAGVATYLVGRNTSGGNRVLQLFTVSNTYSISFSGFINIGAASSFSISLANAPQKDTPIDIETNDSRLYNAVWRNNLLYTATVFSPSSGSDAGQSTVHWMQANTTTNTMADQGNIGGEDIATGTHTFFPSVAVNAIGEMIVGFAASAPTIYPGAYYTFRFPYDPVGTVQSSKTLKAGLDYYYRAFGGSRNRWGDYTGSSVDPTNDITFCLFNEYAMTRGTIITGYPTEDGRYGTVFGIMPQLNVRVLLEGAFVGVDGTFGGYMSGSTDYTLTQPYNTAPWNYSGLESLSAQLPNILDWVLVTLKQDLDPLNPDPTTAVVVARRAGLINLLGYIYDLGGEGFPLAFSVEPGDYYIQIDHRNHLSIMSPTKISITN